MLFPVPCAKTNTFNSAHMLNEHVSKNQVSELIFTKLFRNISKPKFQIFQRFAIVKKMLAEKSANNQNFTLAFFEFNTYDFFSVLYDLLI